MQFKTLFLLAAFAAGVSPALAGTTVYVPLGSAGEVLVIDAGTDTIAGTIAGTEAAHGLAGIAGGKYLVAGSLEEASPDSSAVPAKPEGVSEDAHRAHHANPAAPTAAKPASVSFVSVIRAADGTIVRRIAVPGAVHHAALSPDGRFAVVTHPDGGGVSIIDLSTFEVIKTVQTGPMPNYVVVSADGKRLYVSNAGNGTISEIDSQRWIVRRNFVAGDSPEHVVLSADGTTLYVNNANAGTVSVIPVERGEVVKTYAVGGELHGIDLSEDGKILFVSGTGENKLVAIDLAGGTMRSVLLGPSPYHLATVHGTGKLYVSSAEEPKIWVIDQHSLAVRKEIPIRGEGHQMAVIRR